MPDKPHFYLSVCFVLFVCIAQAQLKLNSPYSKYGIGDLYGSDLQHNRNMGGTGIALGNVFTINAVNPALLTRTKYMVFETGLFQQNNNVSSTAGSQKSGNLNLDYIAFAFPISKRWNSSVIINPYSTLKYQTSTSQELSSNESALYKYIGTGGITQFRFSNSYRFLDDTAKGAIASVGLELSLLYGTVEKFSYSQLSFNGQPDPLVSTFNQSVFYKGNSFKSGLYFRKERLNKTDSITTIRKGIFQNIGIIYGLSPTLKGSENTYAYSYNDNTGVLYRRDTLAFEQKSSITIPTSIGFGYSIDKPVPKGTRADGERKTSVWGVGVDISTILWSQYSNPIQREVFNDNYKVSLGGEFTSDPTRIRKLGYLNRVVYRAGAFYQTGNISLAGQQINQFGINIGASFPMGLISTRNLPRFINLGFAMGQRGTTESNLLKERFWNLSASFTFNNKWFDRPKYGL